MHSLAVLSPSKRQSFYNLSYVNLPQGLEPDSPTYNEELALAIFQTNSIAAGNNVGIFPTTARLNHGCSSAFNSVYTWREKEGVIVVHALKSIKKGEVGAIVGHSSISTLIDMEPSDCFRNFLLPTRTLNSPAQIAGS